MEMSSGCNLESIPCNPQLQIGISIYERYYLSYLSAILRHYRGKNDEMKGFVTRVANKNVRCVGTLSAITLNLNVYVKGTQRCSKVN